MRSYHFTEDVRRVLATAREEATRLRHEYVGTEHILLAYTTPAKGTAAQLLVRVGARPDEIRESIEQISRPGLRTSDSPQDLPYTSRAKKILELAMTEVRDLNHDYVGIEHLLLGIIREEKGIAAQVLAQQGVAADAVRAQILDRPPPGYAPPEEWKGDVKVIGSPAGDFVLKKVRGYGGPHLSRGVVLGISALWVASWIFMRPDILDWRLLGIVLLVAGPPILLWRLTRP